MQLNTLDELFNIRTLIEVTFQREGIHKYPDAPEEVSYLRYPHRHIFHFTVSVEVFHDDRDLEFIMFKKELEDLFGDGRLELDYKSCEMVADDIARYIAQEYPGRQMVIKVSEDGENGAVKIYTRKA